MENSILKIAKINEALDVILSYYDEFYKKNKNKTQRIFFHGDDGKKFSMLAKHPTDFLTLDVEKFNFLREEFIYPSKSDVVYFLKFAEGHLVGVLKYRLCGSSNKPVIGFVDVNKDFQNRGIGKEIIEACFKYHSENKKDEFLFVTDFTDMGKAYIKSVIQKFGLLYGIHVFVTDEYRYLLDYHYNKKSGINSKRPYISFEDPVVEREIINLC